MPDRRRKLRKMTSVLFTDKRASVKTGKDSVPHKGKLKNKFVLFRPGGK